MIIAIDIDGTVTLSPFLFYEIAEKLSQHGHCVFYITGSPQPLQKLHRLKIDPKKVFVCNQGEFKETCAARHGIKVDIWIDNEPGTIQPQRKATPASDDQL